jgi:carbamoyl-phosphate synthase large subunit
MNHYNILVFPGGSEIGLEINRALRASKEVTLFSGSVDVPNHAPFVYKRHFIIPSIHEENWIGALNEKLNQFEIDYIYPAHDDVLVALVQNEQKINSKLIASPLKTCLVTRSKSVTYNYFNGILPVPKVYSADSKQLNFPLFVKPDQGQGSTNSLLVKNYLELKVALERDDSAIVIEYLPGDEVTIDCFSDREKGILFCGGRSRIRTKAGISMCCIPVEDNIFLEYAKRIHMHLNMHGAWFYQLKKDRHGEYKLLEIAPRIAGTMALHRVLGVNFPLLSIYESERIPVTIFNNDANVVIERSLKNRYKHNYHYKSVYIDFDDTLVLNNEVNIELVSFVFQCINKKIPVHLITKHKGDIKQTLNKYKLTSLFDDIIHIDDTDDKSRYIIDKQAILIDDSFAERTNAFNKRKINTFDSSMIEILFDERK